MFYSPIVTPAKMTLPDTIDLKGIYGSLHKGAPLHVSIAANAICMAISPNSISGSSNRVTLEIDDVARAERAIVGIKGKRLTIRTTYV
jgi:hypothetical protein